jgi:hypothetical protein
MAFEEDNRREPNLQQKTISTAMVFTNIFWLAIVKQGG